MAALAHAVARDDDAACPSAPTLAVPVSGHDLKEQAQQQLRHAPLRASPATWATVLRSRAQAARAPADPALRRSVRGALHTRPRRRASALAFTARVWPVSADDIASPLRARGPVVALGLPRPRGRVDPQLMGEVMQGLFFLTPPNRDGLRDALVQPAEMAGYQFENSGPWSRRCSRSPRDTRRVRLPLLQFAASQAVGDASDSRPQAADRRTRYERDGWYRRRARVSHADSVLAELNRVVEQALVRAPCACASSRRSARARSSRVERAAGAVAADVGDAATPRRSPRPRPACSSRQTDRER